MPDTDLFNGKYLSLKTRSDDAGNYTQEFVHESRCAGEIVSILPVHRDRGMLVKHEFTPAWGEGTQIASITGGFQREKHDTPIDAVIEEMREEAGIVIHNEEIIKTLGTVRGSKAMDSLYHLFLVDLTTEEYSQATIETDGSFMERQGSVQWMPEPVGAGLQFDPEGAVATCEWLASADDPLLYTMYVRWMIGFLHRPITRDDYL